MTARWRSLLFVPGNRPELAAKAPRSGPDAVVLDLEDAVPPAAKPDARAQVREAAAGLETVRGVADAREVLRSPVVACYFGAEDYVADLGGVRTAGNAEVAWARAYVAVAARLAGVAALDMVTIDFGDGDRFVAEAREARTLGYAGKLCIHPAQVPLAAEAFRPTEDEVDTARRLLAAFAAAGGDTIAFEGQMVDEVVAARARAILATAAPSPNGGSQHR